MKITYERWETKRFDDLNIGDVFTLDNRVCMKTDQQDVTPDRMKAINLSNGKMFRLGANVHVHPVKAEMIVTA